MKSITAVRNYIEYLKNDCDLKLSLHPLITETVISQSELLRYNLHENPYCIFLKSCDGIWQHCIGRQQKLLTKLENGSWCGTCFAGVKEYIYPILHNGEIIGFISAGCAVSSDGLERVRAVCRNYDLDYTTVQMVYKNLPQSLPPKEYIDTLINPLCDMLELRYSKENPFDLYQDDFFRNLLSYIHLNHNHKLSVEDISRKLNCSKSYISHNFKNKLGLNINEYINNLRIRDSADLLRDSELSVTDIAMAVGFQDSNYFSSCFKKSQHLSPTEYRKAFSRR